MEVSTDRRARAKTLRAVSEYRALTAPQTAPSSACVVYPAAVREREREAEAPIDSLDWIPIKLLLVVLMLPAPRD